jgi:hypothetical protein
MILSYLAELYEAIRTRNELRVHALLRAPEARGIPVAVREEAIAMVRLPAASLRAPMQLFMHLHRMEQLESGAEAMDEREESRDARDPDQLDLPLLSRGAR